METWSSSDATIWLKCLLFWQSSGWSVGSFYFLFFSYVWLLKCYVLLVISWCSFKLCLDLWLDNWSRQVTIATWSAYFHLLFELCQFNFRIHMSQIAWLMKFILLILEVNLSSIVVFLFVTEPTQEWGVCLPRSYQGILDEVRIRKHNT
jgi:hypothetical protein